jgi:Ankyrin repeats (3 copies)
MLPKGLDALDSAYKEAMERIQGQVADSQELAKQVLSWIACAKTPLTTLELRHALAVEIGEPELDEENLPDVEDIISVCAGLVTVDEESDIVRLVHYTTQEYFERTWVSWFPNAQTDITKTCVTYLSFDSFDIGFCQTDEEFKARLRENVLYDYAAYNWGYHACAASTEAEQSVLHFLKNEAKVSASSQAMMLSKDDSWLRRGYSQSVPRQITGVHLTARFGLREVMIALVENGYNLNVKDTHQQTPLWWAAESGHEAVVKLLLAQDGVDPDSKDNYGQTPLSSAAENGHEAVVKLLLSKDSVDPDTKDKHGWTPLLWAAVDGHEAVVKLLLAEDGVDPDSKSNIGRTPLSWAAENGHEAVVKLLLAQDGVDPDSKDNDGRTPLWLAAVQGHEAVARLLEKEAKLDLRIILGG